MREKDRYIKQQVIAALTKKMVFIGGPRQVGKTHFAIGLIREGANETHPAYISWESPINRSKLRNMELPPNEPLIILDEIHKYKQWRNLVKAIFDTQKSIRKILVTGSARLDHYRKGGDSLVNRYRYFRLHPLSLMEISENPEKKDLERLLKFSGFPEPYFAKDEDEHRIWQRDRLTRVIQEDLRDLENVREISLLEQLVDLLPERVGSPLSINGLREDLDVDHKSISRWLTILDNLYVSFRIAPFGSSKIRAVKKEQKLFLWDWSSVPEPGKRFENLVAGQLLKYCHWLEDTKGYRMELRFLRDTDRREVDFVVIQDKKPLFAVECKSGDRAISSAIHYFKERTNIPKFFQVHMKTQDFENGNIRVLPFWTFCKEMQMP